MLVSKTFTFVLKLNKMNFYSTFGNSQIEYLFTKQMWVVFFFCFLGCFGKLVAHLHFKISLWGKSFDELSGRVLFTF